jgi:hypothetical protein
MATIQVILNGMPGGTIHDTDSYPVILQFDEDKTYNNAVWVNGRLRGRRGKPNAERDQDNEEGTEDAHEVGLLGLRVSRRKLVTDGRTGGSWALTKLRTSHCVRVTPIRSLPAASTKRRRRPG